jgi:hypothetical protein
MLTLFCIITQELVVILCLRGRQNLFIRTGKYDFKVGSP